MFNIKVNTRMDGHQVITLAHWSTASGAKNIISKEMLQFKWGEIYFPITVNIYPMQKIC